MTEYIRDRKGQFAGSIGGAVKPPSAAPAGGGATSVTVENSSVNENNYGDMYEKYATQVDRNLETTRPHTPEWTTVRRGSAMPGYDYEGLYIQYRNPATGDIRTEWAGECNGTWEDEHDPAASVIAGLTASGDGYLPYRAVLVSKSPRMERTWDERDVILLGDTIRQVRERVWLSKRS